jgi:hypothetical protein
MQLCGVDIPVGEYTGYQNDKNDATGIDSLKKSQIVLYVHV